MALTPKRLLLSLCISISLLRPYTFFSRSPLVFKTLFWFAYYTDRAYLAALRPIHLNIHIEFDPAMVGKGVLLCCMMSLRKWFAWNQTKNEYTADKQPKQTSKTSFKLTGHVLLVSILLLVEILEGYGGLGYGAQLVLGLVLSLLQLSELKVQPTTKAFGIPEQLRHRQCVLRIVNGLPLGDDHLRSAMTIWNRRWSRSWRRPRTSGHGR